jgi:hypothetical protein
LDIIEYPDILTTFTFYSLNLIKYFFKQSLTQNIKVSKNE